MRLQSNKSEVVPAAVRLDSLAQDGNWQAEGFSGTFFLDYGIVVTITPLFSPRLAELALKGRRDKLKIYVSTPASVDKEIAKWKEARLSKVFTLDSFDKALSPFASSHSFTLEPQGRTTYVAVLSIDAMSFQDEPATPLAIGMLSPQAVSGSTLCIEGSPYALANEAIFVGYKTHGIISAKIGDIIFSDTNFLSGMEGSVVYNEKHEIVGLVKGVLKKRNGEGSITIICPWKLIFPLLVNAGYMASLEMVSNANCAESTGPTDVDLQTPFGVACIIISLNNHSYGWASAVLIAQDIFVTNRHAVPLHQSSVTLYRNSTDKYEAQVIPAYGLDGLDILFLRTSRPVEGLNIYNLSAKVPQQGDDVYAVGFGLFVSSHYSNHLEPLVSKGTVNNVTTLALTKSESEEPTLLTTNAGCWNGSSGGALLNSQGDFVGLLTSNGRQGKQGTILPRLGFVLPINIVGKVWNAVKNGESFYVSEQMKMLWKMQLTHREELIESYIKPKL